MPVTRHNKSLRQIKTRFSYSESVIKSDVYTRIVVDKIAKFMYITKMFPLFHYIFNYIKSINLYISADKNTSEKFASAEYKNDKLIIDVYDENNEHLKFEITSIEFLKIYNYPERSILIIYIKMRPIKYVVFIFLFQFIIQIIPDINIFLLITKMAYFAKIL